jgi:acylphosphatase
MTVRRRLVVRGWVQGVGFRVAVARLARTRGVAGWVRNRADGTVEVVAEGNGDDVASLERFAHDGPRGAEVIRVDAVDEPAEGLEGFEIR